VTVATITPDQLADALSMTLRELCLFLAAQTAKEYRDAADAIDRGAHVDAARHLDRAEAMRAAFLTSETLWDERNPV